MATLEWRGGGRGGGPSRGGGSSSGARRSSGPAASTSKGLANDDVVMSDGGGSGADRRGGKRSRGGRTSGPYNASSRPALNALKAAAEPGSKARRGRSASPGRSSGSSSLARNSSTGSKPAAKTSVLETLAAFMVSRWQPQSGLLDLSKMRDNELLRRGGIAVFGQSGCPANFGKAFWTVAASTCPGLISLSLASNNLKLLSVLDLRQMVDNLPSIQNISLQDNNISSVAELNGLSWTVPQTLHQTGLTGLRELILTGNPVARAVPGTPEYENYRRAVHRRFPTVSQLDGIPVEPLLTPIPPAIRGATSSASQIQFPIGCQPGLTDKPEHRAVVSTFLVKYFGLFDTDRNQLGDAYAAQATYSMHVSAGVTDRSRAHGIQASANGKARSKWDDWMRQSRNLKRMVGKGQGAPEKRVKYFHTGQADIIKALSTLPPTQHPLDKADNFVVDLFAVPNLVDGAADGLMVNIQGELTEKPKDDATSRSFTRSFVLAAPPAGSPSAAAGWPCVIISDQLIIRAYSGPDFFAPDSLVVKPNIALDQGQQLSMATQLAAQTGLTQAFALNCLGELGWDIEKAVAVVAQIRNQIPPEGWA